jgi:stage II sporulation protein D
LPFAAHLCVCAVVLLAWSQPAEIKSQADAHARQRATVEQVDAALQRTAAAALDGRDGTIVVMDAQTGRLRAVVNEQIAADAAFPPGSAVKPFTLLAALRSHAVNADTRLLCRKHYRRGGVEFSCSHPVFKTLFDPAHALAHSCNYFFAHLGERLDADTFDATLAPFGFGALHAGDDAERALNDLTHATSDHGSSTNELARASNISRAQSRVSLASSRFAHNATTGRAPHTDAELSPRLPQRGEWRTETALGEGGGVLATPLQMITAYAALVNGGRLFEPQRAASENFHAHERARLPITDEERALLVAGMRGTVRYGTAEHARLDDLPSRIFGKTGTATEIGGFRTHGWFIGFASDPRPTRDTTPLQASDQTRDSASPDQTRGDVSFDQTRDDQSSDLTSDGLSTQNDQPAPSEVRLAVLIFLRRAQGRGCAEIARPIFAEYARLSNDADEEALQQFDHNSASAPQPDHNSASDDAPSATTNDSRASNGARGGAAAAGDATQVRVRLARDGATVSMPLGDYLFGVLAAEASTEDEFAAIKALAVVSRTYALQKLGRHARDGFDFCTTTHCQRFLRVTPDNARPDFHALLRRAVSETEGEVLRDSRGHLANAYFSASCGGMTANVETLWGTPAREPYERGVADEYCVALPQTRWTDAIPARQLLSALRADPRSDVGSHLDEINVVKRDATGRAELIALTGEQRKILRGWDFKIIVGRTLGWSVVKSSRFSVERAGQTFVFRGSGFGHGLGLCQAGAHVMARNGSSYTQILAHYFPGATIGRLSTAALTQDEHTSNSRWQPDATTPLTRTSAFAPHAATFEMSRVASVARAASLSHSDSAARLTLSSAHFRVNYSARSESVGRRAAEKVLSTLEEARIDLARRLDDANVSQPALPTLEVNAHETTADFVAATGYPAWIAAATRGTRVEMQPFAALERRGVLKQTLRHEYAHAVIDALSHGHAPRWLSEGLAAHFAGEGAVLARYEPAKKIPLDELERRLDEPGEASQMRALYAAAYAEVRALARTGGESGVWRRVAGL